MEVSAQLEDAPDSICRGWMDAWPFFDREVMSRVNKVRTSGCYSLAMSRSKAKKSESGEEMVSRFCCKTCKKGL